MASGSGVALALAATAITRPRALTAPSRSTATPSMRDRLAAARSAARPTNGACDAMASGMTE